MWVLQRASSTHTELSLLEQPDSPACPAKEGFSLLLPPTAILLAPPVKVFLRRDYMILSSVALPAPSAEQGEEAAC